MSLFGTMLKCQSLHTIQISTTWSPEGAEVNLLAWLSWSNCKRTLQYFLYSLHSSYSTAIPPSQTTVQLNLAISHPTKVSIRPIPHSRENTVISAFHSKSPDRSGPSQSAFLLITLDFCNHCQESFLLTSSQRQ